MTSKLIPHHKHQNKKVATTTSRPFLFCFQPTVLPVCICYCAFCCKTCGAVSCTAYVFALSTQKVSATKCHSSNRHITHGRLVEMTYNHSDFWIERKCADVSTAFITCSTLYIVAILYCSAVSHISHYSAETSVFLVYVQLACKFTCETIRNQSAVRYAANASHITISKYFKVFRAAIFYRSAPVFGYDACNCRQISVAVKQTACTAIFYRTFVCTNKACHVYCRLAVIRACCNVYLGQFKIFNSSAVNLKQSIICSYIRRRFYINSKIRQCVITPVKRTCKVFKATPPSRQCQ